MKVDTSAWRSFLVADLFRIINGKGITAEEIESNPGTLEAVQSGEGNNGVIGSISESYCRSRGYSIYDGPCLTVARSGSAGYVSFHGHGCVAGDSAKILVLRNRNARMPQVYLFLQTLLLANRFKYTYGRKVTAALYGRTVLELPTKADGQPDWQWMQAFVDSLHSKPITTGNGAADAPLLRDPSGWKEFCVGQLFESIYKVTPYDDEELASTDARRDGTVPYVTRTDSDNGVKSFVMGSALSNIEAGNAIIIGDTTSTVSYQPEPFVAGEHIIALRAGWLNQFTGLFVTCLLRRERYRYSYGRAYRLDLIRDTVLKLPTKADGQPDWQWMEGYIRSLPYGDRL